MTPEVRLARHWADSARTGRRKRGGEWYPSALRWAEGIAAETGYTVAQVVALLAITSPGIQLGTNLAHAAAIARGERDTGGRFPNINRPKIAAVLASREHAAAYVTGPKVSPFHRAILGDPDALVLDRWAIFAATGDRSEVALGRVAGTKRREVIEAAYRSLARRLRVSVRTLQATIWLQVRETTAKQGTATAPRYFDITN